MFILKFSGIQVISMYLFSKPILKSYFIVNIFKTYFNANN